MRRPLRFHWVLPLDGEKQKASNKTQSGVPNLKEMAEVCKTAEASGIDSLLVAFGFHMPDPIPVVASLALTTEKIKFMIAYRSGIISPTLFVQQINTLSAISAGRVSLNMVAGISPTEQAYYGDFLTHDDRYSRADEFIELSRSFWNTISPVNYVGNHFKVVNAKLSTPWIGEAGGPEIYVGGNSKLAEEVARKHAKCWLRYADTPENIAKASAPLLEDGLEVGLRLSVICRPTREEALQAAYGMIENPDLSWKEFIKGFVASCDSVAVKSTFDLAAKADGGWLNSTLWTGIVPYRGGPAICLVGTPEEIAQAILAYKDAGVSQFIFSGWPNQPEIDHFGRQVIPRVRSLEALQDCH